MILEDIVESTKERVETNKKRHSIYELKEKAFAMPIDQSFPFKKALEKFKEDSKKATITDKGYRLLGKIYKRVSDFVLNNISYESNKSVTNIVNAGVTGDYVDLLAREFFKNENISYKEFKDIVELDKKTGKQFVRINTEDTFNAFKKEIASVKKNLIKINIKKIKCLF